MFANFTSCYGLNFECIAKGPDFLPLNVQPKFNSNNPQAGWVEATGDLKRIVYMNPLYFATAFSASFYSFIHLFFLSFVLQRM